MPTAASFLPPALILGAAISVFCESLLAQEIDRDAARFVEAVHKLNEEHARNPGSNKEEMLAKRLPADARSAFQRVLQAKTAAPLQAALRKCAEAALDLDLINEFEAARQRLESVAPDEANRLGRALSRPRFIVRGIGGLSPDYLKNFAALFDAVLDAYNEVFGFAEFSKVPGKKLRVRVHLEPSITQPPHFAPEFPWHSEIDFPVIDPLQFRSPTPQGQFLFYGICHELGHVIAMWGDLNEMADHHSWAHYTGVVIAEEVSKKLAGQPWFEPVKDVRWRSLELERKSPANQVTPSLENSAGVMALLIRLQDTVGTRAIGEAINRLERSGKLRRVNKVRYYHFADFKQALAVGTNDPLKRKAVLDLFSAPR